MSLETNSSDVVINAKNNLQKDGARSITLDQLGAIETTDGKKALDEAARLVTSTLNISHLEIFLYDATNSTLINPDNNKETIRIAHLEAELNRLFLAGENQSEPEIPGWDVESLGYSHLPNFSGRAGETSQVLMPLVDGPGLYGMLKVDLRQPLNFSDSDMDTLEAVANWFGKETAKLVGNS